MTKFVDRNQSNDILEKLNEDRKIGTKTCDIKLECDGKTFYAHKWILSKVSEYFEKLFYSEMKEKYQDTVQVNGMTAETFGHMLEFIYTSEITIDTDNLHPLLAAANYLLVQGIIGFCAAFLRELLDCSNAAKNWVQIKKLDLPTHTKICENFLKEKFAFLPRSEDIDLMDADLFQSFIETRRKDAKSEETAFRFTVAWVEHDLEERKHLFPQLFEIIDLKLVNPEFLSYDVADQVLVAQFPSCLLRFAKHIKYFIGPNPDNSIITINENSTSVKLLDIKKGVEKEILKLEMIRTQSSFAMYKNYLYMIGGFVSDLENKTDSVFRLDVRSPNKGWEKQPSLNKERRNAGVAVFNDSIFVFGGFTKEVGTFTVSNIPEKMQLEPEAKEWTKMKTTKNLPIDVTVCQGVLYSMYYPATLTCEKYDPVTETSTLMPNLPDGCVKLVAMEDQLYAICKVSNQLSICKYDPESGESHDKSKDISVGEFRDACVAHGQIVVSYKSIVSVVISAYNFDAKEWKRVTISLDNSDYWKLIPFHSNPFE